MNARIVGSERPAANGNTSWHEGERRMQALAGIGERMAELGPRVIRDHMPDQHRDFFAQLPFLVAGTVDGAGQPWASALAGVPGFVHSPDSQSLLIDALPQPQDPMTGALRPGASIGLLGIEPQTRRRNRMNGVIEAIDPHGFAVSVRQSFGNCPKYIQAREPRLLAVSGELPPARFSTALDPAMRRIVEAADTFFIASVHPRSGNVDVSHRGGRPGFVRVDGDGTLAAPDFIGNFFFNTFGNIAVEPRAGLLFVDFDSGDLLQLAVEAEVIWDGPELARFAGAERLLRMRLLGALLRPVALPLRWSAAQPSPYLAATGQWAEAA